MEAAAHACVVARGKRWYSKSSYLASTRLADNPTHIAKFMLTAQARRVVRRSSHHSDTTLLIELLHYTKLLHYYSETLYYYRDTEDSLKTILSEILHCLQSVYTGLEI